MEKKTRLYILLGVLALGGALAVYLWMPAAPPPPSDAVAELRQQQADAPDLPEDRPKPRFQPSPMGKR